MISHFSFRRGEKIFEVFVAEKWDTKNISATVQSIKKATPLFLEIDDFSKGHEAFALDFLLMKKNGKHLSGKNIIETLSINTGRLKNNIESEVRRLATKLRTSYFFSEYISSKTLLVTLSGIAQGLEYLGHTNPFPKKVEQEVVQIKNIFSPQKQSDALLTLLQEWEDFLNA